MPTGDLRRQVGIYLHVPFCRRKCPYCDFAVTVSSRPPIDDYHAAMRREMDERAAEAAGRELRSIYFGGGTPSLSSTETLLETLAHVRSLFEGTPTEVTLEVNPEDGRSLDYGALRRGGVTRLSFGAQSFDPHVLSLLGRAHTADQIRECVRTSAEAGFESLSIDLIHGVPGQTADRLTEDLREIAELPELDHVSIYELTIEPKTSFASRRRRGELHELGEDALANELRVITDTLTGVGFQRYEVSSYARPGGEAVHNSAYWAGTEYLGIGVGAHSFAIQEGRAERRANGRSTRRYLQNHGDGAETSVLTHREHLAERLLVGLRTTIGVDLADLRSWARAELDLLRPLFVRWENRGLVTIDGQRVCPTEQGLLVADSLAADMVDVLL